MDFLGPKEMIIWFEQNLSKNLPVAYKLFVDIYYTQRYGEKVAKNFSHRDRSRFFEKLFLSTS